MIEKIAGGAADCCKTDRRAEACVIGHFSFLGKIGVWRVRFAHAIPRDVAGMVTGLATASQGC
jgi:hypothetical protein